MTPELWKEVKATFEAALELPPAERSAFLDGRVGRDNEARQAVDRLLHAEPESTGYLEPPTPETLEDAGAVSKPMPSADLVGTEIGGYRIVRPLGHGGMGSVYEAVQLSPHRTVALKVMRSGLVSATAVRRFRYEAELLARLHHPGIAQIYEAGVREEGGAETPWFAMELLEDAAPILNHAERNHLELERRVDLFREVCAAVHHGHQRGVIHRDLKPANILVDRDGRAKVIDFGIGRATDAAEEAGFQLTREGDLLGTLQYMSPEQLSGRPEEVDVRTDVYSLGVVLYELLTGSTPHDLRGKSLTEKGQIIGEQEPPKPSTRAGSLPPELDWITVKAMAKEPDRRYASVQDLAEDLRRLRAHQPVQAGPPSRSYYMRKFVRRNRVAVIAAALVLLTLLTGVTVSVLFAVEANAQRDVAEDKRDEARRASYATILQNAAFRIHDRPDAQEALQLLHRAPEEYRGWEWRHLWSTITHDRHAFLETSSLIDFDWAVRVGVVVITLDQGLRQVVVLGPEPGVERRLDVESAHCAALSRDARFLYVGTLAGSVIRYDLRENQQHTLRSEDGEDIHRIATVGTDRLVVGTEQGAVELWDVNHASLLVRRQLHQVRINALVADEAGNLIATAGADGKAFILDGRDGSSVHVHQVEGGIVGVSDIALLPGGKGVIAVWGPKGQASLWRPNARSIDFQPNCRACSVAPDGSIAVVWEQRVVKVYRDLNGLLTQVRTLVGRNHASVQVAWSLDGTELYTASSIGEISRFDLATPPAWLQQVSQTKRGVSAVAVGVGGSQAWVGGFEGDIVRCTLGANDHHPLRDADNDAHSARVTTLRISPDGTRLLSASLDGTLAVWDAAQAKLLARIDVGEEITDAAFLPDGRSTAVSLATGAIAMVALDDGELRLLIEGAHEEYATCVAVASDGGSIVSGSEGGGLVCHAQNGDERWRIDDAHARWVPPSPFLPMASRSRPQETTALCACGKRRPEGCCGRFGVTAERRRLWYSWTVERGS